MAKIIVVSKLGNQKGQTLLSAHLATFLAAQHKTAIVDFEPQNHILEMFVAKRCHFNLKHQQNLPVPSYFTYKKNLLTEIGESFDFIVLDTKETVFFQTADILLTLVSDHIAAESLSQKESPFAQMLWQAKKERAKTGKQAFKHILIPNISLSSEDMGMLKSAMSLMGYKIAPCLHHNPSYAEALHNGLTILDKDTPYLLKTLTQEDFFARRNFMHILQTIW